MKFCPKCNLVRPISEFRVIHADNGRHYLVNECKECLNARKRNAADKPPEIVDGAEYSAFVGVKY